MFDIEEYFEFPKCADSRWGDYFRLYDGLNTTAPLVGTYCGTHFPDIIISTGNAFFIEFHSDQGVSGNGFQFAFKHISQN